MHTVNAAEAAMIVELAIDSTKKLPKTAVPAMKKNFSTRLQDPLVDLMLARHRAGSERLCALHEEKEVKKKVEKILQQTRESADDWFY